MIVLNGDRDHIKTAADRSEAENIPELIEWANGSISVGSVHDAFVHGVGAAMDVIGDRMEELLPRCEDNKLHDLDEMEFVQAVPHEYRRCEDCGEQIRGEPGVRYRVYQSLMKQKYADWRHEPGTGRDLGMATNTGAGDRSE